MHNPCTYYAYIMHMIVGPRGGAAPVLRTPPEYFWQDEGALSGFEWEGLSVSGTLRMNTDRAARSGPITRKAGDDDV